MTQLFSQQYLEGLFEKSTEIDSIYFYRYLPNLPYIKGLLKLSEEVSSDYSNMLSYIWENHSLSFDLLSLYSQVKSYEKKYGKSSDKLFSEWKKGTLLNRDIYINHWLNIYLQIKDFIK